MPDVPAAPVAPAAGGTPAPAGATIPAAAAPVAPTAPQTPAAPAPGSSAAPAGTAAEPAKTDGVKPDASADFEVKLPDGATIDQKVLGEAKAIVADPKLSPKERLEKLFALQAASQSVRAMAEEKAIEEFKTKQRDTHLAQLKADKDFGGARYEATLKAATSAEAQFFGGEFAKVLQEYGLENHPSWKLGLARIRSAIAEATMAGTVRGTEQNGASKAYLENKARYPKSPELWGSPN